MSCINNASEPPKEKNSKPENNSKNSRTALLICATHCFLANVENSFVGVWRVEKESLNVG